MRPGTSLGDIQDWRRKRGQMNLHRISKDPISDHDASSQDYRSSGDKVRLDFRNFTARDQGSYFQATFDWSDVTILIGVFADANHPDAARLVQAQKIASVRSCGNSGAIAKFGQTCARNAWSGLWALRWQRPARSRPRAGRCFERTFKDLDLPSLGPRWRRLPRASEIWRRHFDQHIQLMIERGRTEDELADDGVSIAERVLAH